MLHVTDLIQHLDIDQLIKDELLPPFKHILCGTATQVKRYPTYVYKEKSFSTFGWLMDYFIRGVIAREIPVKLGQDPILKEIELCPTDIKDRIEEAMKLYLDKNIAWNKWLWPMYQAVFLAKDMPIKEFSNRSYKLFGGIAKTFRQKFEPCAKSNVEFNAELKSGIIFGHPDIIQDNLVLDIKTCSKFYNTKNPQMVNSAMLQIFSYVALSRDMGKCMDNMGILLPLQHDILMFDVSTWNSKPFLDLLLKTAKSLHIHQPEFEIINVDIDVVSHIGTHICKGKDIASTLETYALTCLSQFEHVNPCQTFLRNGRTGTCATKESELDPTLALVESYAIPYFTHSPYIINLADPFTYKDKTSDEWVLGLLRSDLKMTRRIGGRGVVVHVGKRKKIPLADALDTMEKSVRKVLCEATDECPLLLETPAGEGTEVCTTIEDLSAFYQRFNDDPRFKICIDTCHVFASGYDPLDYLQQWHQLHPDSIKLVHFNDSKKAKGSRVDRHAPMGYGHIGTKRLLEVASWCYYRNIPMVIE